MLKLARLLRIAAVLALGIASHAAVQPARAQGRCSGGGGMGYSRGGGGGGYYGGGYAGGGMSQPYGSAANYYQSPYDSTSQYSGSQQPAATSGAGASLNNPATVLAHADGLNLTGKQVQLLEKMQKSGKQRAMLILTKDQRKQLVGSIGSTRKANPYST